MKVELQPLAKYLTTFLRLSIITLHHKRNGLDQVAETECVS